MAGNISPKVIASGFGTAVATIFWIIASATFWQDVFTEQELVALTGSTAVVIAGLLGYLVPDPARRDPPKAPIPPLDPLV